MPDFLVRLFIMRDMICLREEVIIDINQLWTSSKQNQIMMQNYLDSQKEEIIFNKLTLKDYIIEITCQRVEKLEFFNEDVCTHMG